MSKDDGDIDDGDNDVDECNNETLNEFYNLIGQMSAWSFVCNYATSHSAYKKADTEKHEKERLKRLRHGDTMIIMIKLYDRKIESLACEILSEKELRKEEMRIAALSKQELSDEEIRKKSIRQADLGRVIDQDNGTNIGSLIKRWVTYPNQLKAFGFIKKVELKDGDVSVNYYFITKKGEHLLKKFAEILKRKRLEAMKHLSNS